MASVSVSVSMALPLSSAAHNRSNLPSSEAFFRPLKRSSVVKKSEPRPELNVEASLKEKAVKGSRSSCRNIVRGDPRSGSRSGK
ncbi:hypothetical protein E2542_SST30441 [Spatholobus suberectus]|nr:hypothetical protein E2542_SST30441 [Spatholobus suberectus]